MKESKTSNYDHEEFEYISDFLNIIKENSTEENPTDDFFPIYELSHSKSIDETEKNILYYMSGHVISSVAKLSVMPVYTR